MKKFLYDEIIALSERVSVLTEALRDDEPTGEFKAHFSATYSSGRSDDGGKIEIYFAPDDGDVSDVCSIDLRDAVNSAISLYEHGTGGPIKGADRAILAKIQSRLLSAADLLDAALKRSDEVAR